MSAQKTLKDDFAARQNWYANRSSAVFPVRQKPHTDLSIVFLNYWHVKNKLQSVLCNIRLYSSDGTLLGSRSQKVEGFHNEISIRQMAQQDFEGIAEVEFISLENLRFTFPAIIGLYRAGDNYSVVHSAGRVKNSYEPFADAESLESNWSCKFSENSTPFAHVFNGPHALREGLQLEAALYNGDGSLVDRQAVQTTIKASFSSQFLYFDEIFAKSKTKGLQQPFVLLRVPNGQVFSRLVVGNFYRDTDFLEVTHSFPKVLAKEDRIKNETTEIRSFLVGIQPEGLSLDLVSFPTNLAQNITAKVRQAKAAGQSLQASGEGITWQTGGEGVPVFVHKMREQDFLVSLDLYEKEVPARINANYVYRVRGSSAPFSTDLATGAKSCDYPPKHSHWGHGLLSKDYDTVIALRNMSHNPSEHVQNNSAQLTLYVRDQVLEHRFQMAPESGCALQVKSLLASLGRDFDFAETEAFSWYISAELPYAESFWVAYAADGRICGEHGF